MKKFTVSTLSLEAAAEFVEGATVSLAYDAGTSWLYCGHDQVRGDFVMSMPAFGECVLTLIE